jgi:hypothetical protein
MGKRTRGSQRASQRRPSARTSTGRPATGRPRTVIDRLPSQLDAATEIAEEVVEQRPAAAAEGLRTVSRSSPARARAKPGSLLAAKAATEYVYVVQDLRRIAVVAIVLFGILLALWVVRLVL